MAGQFGIFGKKISGKSLAEKDNSVQALFSVIRAKARTIYGAQLLGGEIVLAGVYVSNRQPSAVREQIPRIDADSGQDLESLT